MPAIIILVVIVLLILARCLRIVPQAYVYVVERLGAYHASWITGLHIAIPIIDRVSKKVNLKELVADFPPQPVITKDNVTMQIDTVIYMQITVEKGKNIWYNGISINYFRAISDVIFT